ncbi:MAG: GNAT family N-acetyltransferase [Pseudomonadota bacterium]
MFALSHEMDGIFACDDRDAMPAFAGDWDRLAAAETLYTPPFTDFDGLRGDPNLYLRLVGYREHGQVVHLAVFASGTEPRTYWLGPKRLMALSVRTVRLFGSTVVGGPDEVAMRAMLTAGLAGHGKDLLAFEDLPASSALMLLAEKKQLDGPVRISHHNTARRLIGLPATMEDYWAALRPNTRKTAQRDQRYFERCAPQYSRFTGRDAAKDFLPAAAAVSAQSYQSGLGFGLRDDAKTRSRFDALADEGRLRCYLATVDGVPAAFAWGDVAHGVFYFRMTGYDPALGRNSAGKAIMFEVIRDLIETRAANTFDFGIRDMPYKERFGTMTIDTAHVLVACSLRGRIALTLDRSLDASKAIILRLINPGRLAQIKRRLRG